MTIQYLSCAIVESPYIQWVDYALTVVDDTPDDVIPLRAWINNAPSFAAGVKSGASVLRLAPAYLPQFITFMAIKSDGQKVYFSRDIDLLSDVAITIYAIDETGAGPGGGGGQAHIAGTVTVEGAAAARDIIVISNDKAGGRKVLAEGASAGDGSFDINYTDWGGAVIALSIDEYGIAFPSETALNEGEVVHPTTPNGYVYTASQAGTTGTSEPAWPTSGTVQSGSVTFTARRYYRPIASGPLNGELIP
jgi:hypothetical protein